MVEDVFLGTKNMIKSKEKKKEYGKCHRVVCGILRVRSIYTGRLITGMLCRGVGYNIIHIDVLCPFTQNNN